MNFQITETYRDCPLEPTECEYVIVSCEMRIIQKNQD